MKNALEFGSKEAGVSAVIKIYGNADSVDVYLLRGSTTTKHYTIFLNPSWLQELRDRMNNIGLGINNTPREYYNAKIRDIVKQYSAIANNYVVEDNLQLKQILENRKTEEQNRIEHEKYIDTLITELESKS